MPVFLPVAVLSHSRLHAGDLRGLPQIWGWGARGVLEASEIGIQFNDAEVRGGFDCLAMLPCLGVCARARSNSGDRPSSGSSFHVMAYCM